MRIRSATVAALAVLLAFCWQLIVVQTTYQGNWTGLFCAGERFNRPQPIVDREFVFHGSSGYDGQFYQVIAHDPLLTRHYDAYIDAPRLRYRRILMPALAGILAAEQEGGIDFSFVVVCLIFAGLGTYCLAALATDAGRAPWWGMLFLITPATLLGLERMTVDISLAALSLAALLAAHRQRWALLWLSLAGAMLSKETGIIVIAAVVFWLARQRRFPLAALMSASALPALGWYAFIQSHTAGDYATSGFKFMAPFFVILTIPVDPGIASMIFRIATVLAVLGLLWSAIRGIVLGIQERLVGLETLLLFLFAALLLLFQTESIWGDPNGFARIYSPLLVCLVAATWKRGFTQTVVSFAVVAFPICMQLGYDLARPLLTVLNYRISPK